MLILPLHRHLARNNFPYVTAILVLVNLFVFFGLQMGKQDAGERAYSYYRNSALPAIEYPAYKLWTQAHPDSDQLKNFDGYRGDPDALMLVLIQADEEFQADLHADRIVTAGSDDYATWHEQRAVFDYLWSGDFTERHVLRYSHIEPGRMLSGMFLHGGLSHLFGNMLFLVALGLLVEGALGTWLFLAVYLLAGLGAQTASLLWHWGEAGNLLGASGAIAGLMGAYCVLWGRRKVRFFWWFFVVFDYIKAPALILLPFWLGWEILNLLFNSGSHVSFDTHAGGILSGAALALLVQRLDWQRDAFLDEDTHVDRIEQDKRDLATAQAHLGRLELDQARRVFESLDQQQAGNLAVRKGLYRCARYSRNMQEVHKKVIRVLELPLLRNDELREQKSIYDDYRKIGNDAPRLPAALLLSLAQRWLDVASADAEAILRELCSTAPGLPDLPAIWWKLALRADADEARRRARLEFFSQQYPQSPEAEKARFLLQGATRGQ